MAERIYCAEAAADDRLAGTAVEVDVWLLLEYRPVWKAKALEEGDLAEPARAWMARMLDGFAERGLKARAQLIRQPEVDRDDVRLLAGIDGALHMWSGSGYDFLQSLDLTDPESLSRGEVISEPQYFVCTNGQRDLCCARFGLPVYNRLREVVGERAWQITHLGGHRFAPNVLALPQSALYGRLQTGDVSDFVGRVDRGELGFHWLRGRTTYPKHVQAAEAFSGRNGLRLLHVNGDADKAAVTFSDASERIHVQVRRDSAPAMVLTSCADDAPSEVFAYRQADAG
ncbi:MAG: hypothetical protein CMQ49_01720 [Gammaproteobacteria bacterium]|nr:hypothetical protein [Gammaproteobacteria bacterium]